MNEQLELTDELCRYCAQETPVDFLEIYREDRSWQWTFCCEEFQDEYLASFGMATPEEKAAELERLGWSYYTGRRPRAVYDDCGHAEVDECLELRKLEGSQLQMAKNFVREHHRHNKPPCGWRFGFGVWNLGELVAVAISGRPVARMLNPAEVIEVTRVCAKHTAGNIERHACSMLYGACAREAKARGFKQIITYTLESERGTACKAAGFVPVARTRGGSWNRPSRAREDKAPTCPKVRWERRLAV